MEQLAKQKPVTLKIAREQVRKLKTMSKVDVKKQVKR